MKEFLKFERPASALPVSNAPSHTTVSSRPPIRSSSTSTLTTVPRTSTTKRVIFKPPLNGYSLGKKATAGTEKVLKEVDMNVQNERIEKTSSSSNVLHEAASSIAKSISQPSFTAAFNPSPNPQPSPSPTPSPTTFIIPSYPAHLRRTSTHSLASYASTASHNSLEQKYLSQKRLSKKELLVLVRKRKKEMEREKVLVNNARNEFNALSTTYTTTKTRLLSLQSSIPVTQQSIEDMKINQKAEEEVYQERIRVLMKRQKEEIEEKKREKEEEWQQIKQTWSQELTQLQSEIEHLKNDHIRIREEQKQTIQRMRIERKEHLHAFVQQLQYRALLETSHYDTKWQQNEKQLLHDNATSITSASRMGDTVLQRISMQYQQQLAEAKQHFLACLSAPLQSIETLRSQVTLLQEERKHDHERQTKVEKKLQERTELLNQTLEDERTLITSLIEAENEHMELSITQANCLGLEQRLRMLVWQMTTVEANTNGLERQMEECYAIMREMMESIRKKRIQLEKEVEEKIQIINEQVALRERKEGIHHPPPPAATTHSSSRHHASQSGTHTDRTSSSQDTDIEVRYAPPSAMDMTVKEYQMAQLPYLAEQYIQQHHQIHPISKEYVSNTSIHHEDSDVTHSSYSTSGSHTSISDHSHTSLSFVSDHTPSDIDFSAFQGPTHVPWNVLQQVEHDLAELDLEPAIHPTHGHMQVYDDSNGDIASFEESIDYQAMPYEQRSGSEIEI